MLLNCIECYINEKIILAAKAIAKYSIEKINDRDVILVYGWWVRCDHTSTQFVLFFHCFCFKLLCNMVNTCELRQCDGVKKCLLPISSSSLVNHILCEAFEKNKKFRVIVVDSRPRLEGREALRRLVQRGIRCTYVLISAVSYILPEARKKNVLSFSDQSASCVVSES